MLLPLFGWALTGLIFFIKPGYEGAYEALTLKTYPLEQGFTITSDAQWNDARMVRSILGHHLLVKAGGRQLHLNPSTLEEMSMPKPEQLLRILTDTISQNTERYGEIESIGKIEESVVSVITTNGVEITLDWDQLTFTQKGNDRKIISLLYKIHYLQWTPWSAVNQWLGVLGLVFLVALSVFGAKVYVSNRQGK